MGYIWEAFLMHLGKFGIFTVLERLRYRERRLNFGINLE